jgi:hypothetical protein
MEAITDPRQPLNAIGPPPDNNYDDYTWLGSMGWVKNKPITERDVQLSEETAAINAYGRDQIADDWSRVGHTGQFGWIMGGDLGNFMDVAWYDEDKILNMFQDPTFNPFYHDAVFTPQERDRYRELGLTEKFGIDKFDNRIQNNIMDYLYAKTKGQEGFEYRRPVYDAFKKYMRDRGIKQTDLYQTRMTKEAYDAMGLGSILGEFDESFNPAPKAEAATTSSVNQPSASVGYRPSGAFTGTSSGLTYSPVQLPSIAPSPSIKNVDYVQLLRGALTKSLFKDLI